ncbi:hypothetical protein Pla86_38440 [Planctomycetes bacterium Pla86]|uniref:Uncharacterized protein n=2 Tax=Engelhardtia mirabilis TaxID=2528011 RepID=A0A518BP37_9BACT|nr:hypothetical protein Pla133_38450 [Planctomycetes bacterium Pla133]QDV03069.1 hypothetical protein Pla86_38440 [Planctomycetes bacterium Pla86]
MGVPDLDLDVIEGNHGLRAATAWPLRSPTSNGAVPSCNRAIGSRWATCSGGSMLRTVDGRVVVRDVVSDAAPRKTGRDSGSSETRQPGP